MPYPPKISASSILAAALERLEAAGPDALSMRTLASDLNVTAGSLYRYYPDRAALEEALAGEGFRMLRDALAAATVDPDPSVAAYSAARAYLAFAREHPALYDLLMSAHEGTSSDLWEFVLTLIARVTREPNEDAAVALWAYLHGFVALERGGVIGSHKPWSSFEVGFAALLRGLVAPAAPRE